MYCDRDRFRPFVSSRSWTFMTVTYNGHVTVTMNAVTNNGFLKILNSREISRIGNSHGNSPRLIPTWSPHDPHMIPAKKHHPGGHERLTERSEKNGHGCGTKTKDLLYSNAECSRKCGIFFAEFKKKIDFLTGIILKTVTQTKFSTFRTCAVLCISLHLINPEQHTRLEYQNIYSAKFIYRILFIGRI